MERITKEAATRNRGGSIESLSPASLDKTDFTRTKLLSEIQIEVWASGERMEKCRKFKSCNAPNCPLDSKSLEAIYLHGEPICFWVTEFQKKQYRNLQSSMETIPLELIGRASSRLRERYSDIRIRLNNAKRTPSRIPEWHCE